MISTPRIRAAVILTTILFSVLFFTRTSAPSLPWRAKSDNTKPANSTLGFGAIYVVSGPNSPRRDHLEQAAAVTEIDLVFPEQKTWTDQDLENFRGMPREQSKIGDGSIKAWLSHHLVLQAFVDSGLDTALIIENDVDWDVRLRTSVVPLAQNAFRRLFSSGDAKSHPWGTKGWDLLWLGHCGDTWLPWGKPRNLGHFHPDQLHNERHIVYEDKAVPWYDEQHPWTASLLNSFRIPQKHRVIHPSKFPLCTFGYAVTREGAQKILTKAAVPREISTPDAHAFDVALLNACGWTKNLLSCWSLQPEIFHHKGFESAIGAVEGNPFISESQNAGGDNEMFLMETANLECGFKDASLFYDGNLQRLEQLRARVRKGECPKLGKS